MSPVNLASPLEDKFRDIAKMHKIYHRLPCKQIFINLSKNSDRSRQDLSLGVYFVPISQKLGIIRSMSIQK